MVDGYYRLDENKQVVPATQKEAWAFSADFERKRVARTKVGDSDVSTVFLTLDHGFRDGLPVVFETLVFRGPLADEMDRYCTWDEAVAGHDAMVARVRAAMS